MALVVGAYVTTAASKIYNEVSGVSGATLNVNPVPNKIAYWKDTNTLESATFLTVNNSTGTLTASGKIVADDFCTVSGKCLSAAGGGSGGTSVWKTNGSSIFFIGGDVGIGTINPQYALDVNGDVHFGSEPETIYVGKYTKIVAEPRNAAGDRDIWFQSTIWLANRAPTGWQGGTLVLSAQPPHDFKLENGTVTPSNLFNKTWVFSYSKNTNDLVLYANKGTGNRSTTWYNALRWGMNKELNINVSSLNIGGKKVCILINDTTCPSGFSKRGNLFGTSGVIVCCPS